MGRMVLDWPLGWSAAGKAALIVVLGVVAGVTAAIASANPTIALTVALCIVAPLPIVVRLVQRRFDPFEPIQIISLTFILLYAVRPAAEQIYNLDSFYDKSTTEAGYNGAALIALIGMCSIYAGYAVGAGRKIAARMRPLPDSWDPERSVRFAIWLLVFAGLLTLLFAATVGFGTLLRFYLGRTQTDFQTFLAVSGYVALGPYLTIPASFILIFAYSRLRTLKVGLLLAATLAVATYVTVPRGDRTYILFLVLPLLVLWFLRRGRRPTAVGAAIAVFVAILGMNILLAVRHVDKRNANGGIINTVGTALTHPGTQLKEFATGVDLGEFSVLELEYQAFFSPGGGLDFHPGSTPIALAVYPLPRKLVGTKPKSAGEYVSPVLFPQTGPNAKRASFNSGMFGDEFADAAWFTVILYSLIIGVGVRVLWEYFKRFSTSDGLQIVFAAALPVLVVMIRNGEIDALGRSLFQVGPLILCLLVCSRPAMRRFAGFRVRPKAAAAPPPEGASP
jgi:hypothetical protein